MCIFDYAQICPYCPIGHQSPAICPPPMDRGTMFLNIYLYIHMYALALSVRCDLTNGQTVPLFRAPHGVLPLAIPPSIHACLLHINVNTKNHNKPPFAMGHNVVVVLVVVQTTCSSCQRELYIRAWQCPAPAVALGGRCSP